MGKLLEVIRRLAVALVWLFGGGFAFLCFGKYYKGHWQTGVRDHTELAVVLSVLVGTYIAHRVINWILLKEDKPFQD
mgnify:CR=1 FL=1